MPTNGTQKDATDDAAMLDLLCHVRTTTLRYGTPLGFPSDGAEHASVTVCNIGQEALKTILDSNMEAIQRSQNLLSMSSSTKHVANLSDRIRLDIALRMRGNPKEYNQYTFWPTYLLFNTEGCMILQMKAFHVIRGASSSDDKIVEISIEEHAVLEGKQDVVLVHDIAFGPTYKRHVTPPSLWFNLVQDDLVPCPTHIAKKYVDTLKGRKKWQASPVSVSYDYRPKNTPFFHIRPHDEDAFLLVTDLMIHRLQQLHTEEEFYSFNGGRRDPTLEIMKDIAILHEYHKHKRFWDEWMNWPATEAHKIPTDLNEVAPTGDCEYVIGNDHVTTSRTSPHRHLATVWDSFIKNKGAIDVGCSGEEISPPRTGKSQRRLRVFRDLSNESSFHGNDAVHLPAFEGSVKLLWARV